MIEKTWEEIQAIRLESHLKSDELIIKDGKPVCSFCGGNCGQCGHTDIIGNVPFDFDQIVSTFGVPQKPKDASFGRKIVNLFFGAS
jgi:hypothetical protein